MTKTVLVSGGGGYLGSVLTHQLLKQGYAIRVFDRLFFGREPLAAYLEHPRFELIVGDLRRLDDFPHLLDGVDAVIHLAGLSNDPCGDLRPEHTLAIQVEGTRRLAEQAVAAGVQRFLFASSCSVYGAGLDSIMSEDSAMRPVSLYAESKIQAEQILLNEFPGRLSPTILRMATLFGISPRMRFDLAINLMTLHAIQRGKISVMGGGNQWRPLIHVRDAASAYLICLEQPIDRVVGQVFNVGDDSYNFRIGELAEVVASTIGDVAIEVAPDDADRRSYRVSFEKARRLLGFIARTSVEQGAREIALAIRSGEFGDCTDRRYFTVKRMRELFDTPAVDGGEPIRSSFLPFALPLLGREEEEEVLDTLRSGWLTTGPKTARFERLVAEYVGAKHAIAVNSCTAALHLALAAQGVGPGDEVLVPAITFPATANVVFHQGATPVLVDVEPATLNVDVEDAARRITARTKAIVPVHMAGHPCNMAGVYDLADKHGLVVIEDAAHALGASWNGKRVGSLPRTSATCFSFYPIKNMTTVEGGAITTDDDELAEKARVLSLHGISRDAWKRYGRNGSPHWETVSAGFKYNMSDVQAAIGIPQLAKLEGFLAVRERYARAYTEAFAELPGLSVLRVDPSHRHAWHLFIALLDDREVTISRDALLEALRAENIATGIHFQSLHLQRLYRERLHHRPENLPVAAAVSGSLFSLPLYPKMTEDDILSVIQAVRKVITHRRRAFSITVPATPEPLLAGAGWR